MLIRGTGAVELGVGILHVSTGGVPWRNVNTPLRSLSISLPYNHCLATNMPGKKNNKGGKRSKKVKNQRSLPLVTTTPSSRHIMMSFAASGGIAESAAGSGVTYFMRLNSVYDPDATGVGTSAIGYSTWSALYLSYKVNRVTVRVQGTVTGLSAGAFANAILAPIPFQAVVPANKQTWKMIPGARMKVLTNNSVGGSNMFNMTATYDIARVARVTKQQYKNDMDWSGQVGSNPARQVYCLIAFDSVGSSSVMTANYNTQVTYEVEWFNPVPMQ